MRIPWCCAQKNAILVRVNYSYAVDFAKFKDIFLLAIC